MARWSAFGGSVELRLFVADEPVPGAARRVGSGARCYAVRMFESCVLARDPVGDGL